MNTRLRVSFAFGSWSFQLIPWLIWLGSHRTSNLATSVPSRNRTITQTWSVLYLFNCMCLRLSQESWVSVLQFVASQMGILPPYIYLTQYQKGRNYSPLEWSSTCRINHNLGEPPNLSSIPREESHFWHPWVGLIWMFWGCVCGTNGTLQCPHMWTNSGHRTNNECASTLCIYCAVIIQWLHV